MLNGVLSVLEPYEVKVSSTVLRGERTEMSRPTRHKKMKNQLKVLLVFHFFSYLTLELENW